MVRQWSTGRTSEILVRIVLTIAILATFSYVSADVVAASIDPTSINDHRLKFAAAIFGVLLVVVSGIAYFLRRKARTGRTYYRQAGPFASEPKLKTPTLAREPLITPQNESCVTYCSFVTLG